MSTVRIQVRRGLSSEWTSVNPILAAGEMGLESDTNFIKFGNGTDHWADLAYANEPLSDLQNTLADYVLLSDVGQPNGVASLNSSGKVPSNQLDIAEAAQDAVANAFIAGTNLTQTYNDAANTFTVDLDNSIVLTGDLTVQGGSTVEALTVNGNLTVNGTTTTVNTANFTTQDALLYIGTGNSGNTVDLGIVGHFNDGTYQHSGLVRDASDGVWKLFSGVTTEPGATIDFTTHTKDSLEIGSLSATTAVIGNVTNNELQYIHGVTSAIQTQLDNKQPKVANVSDTEIGYLDGVTSAIQTQIDAKLNSSTANSTYAPIASPNFTGTVGGITKAMVGLSNVDNTSDANKPVSSAVQAALDLKLDTATATSTYAPKAGPTFTGTVVLPSTTSIGNVSATEIGYVDGVTSSIQTQLNTGATNLTNHSNATTSVHGISDTANLVYTTDTGTVTSTMIANGTIVNADINNSAAIALSKLATDPLARANHTGSQTASTISDFNEAAQDAVGGILGSGLTYNDAGNAITVDSSVIQLRVANVSDTEIAYLDGVTSAIQTQIDGKLGLSGGTLTGALTLSGAPTSDLHAATKGYVDGVTAGINFHQAVKATTTTNLSANYSNGTNGFGATLTADTNRAFTTLDGVSSWSVGDRILIKDQTTATQNGIYTLTTVGSSSAPWVLTRAVDADNNPSGELATGDFCFVTGGTVNANTGFILSTTGTITLGTTNVNYTQFNAAQAITAGSGLTKTGGTLSIATGAITSDMILDGTIVDADINASAAIAQSKISGLSTSLGLKANLAAPSFTGGVTVDSSGVIFTDGSQTKAGIPSLTYIYGATNSNAKTNSYTLSSLSERDTFIEVNSSSATTISIPTDATLNYPIGTSIDIAQMGTGQVTIAAVTPGTTTVNATPGLKLRTQYSTATLFKRGANTWIVYGDLTA